MLYGKDTTKKVTLIRPPVLFLFLLSCGMLNPLTLPIAAAGFNTNFNTDGISGAFYNNWNGACLYAGNCPSNYLGNGDPTAFFERAEQINGSWYFHAIVGDPATGFAQESYTRISGNAASITGGCTTPVSCDMANGFSPDGAGMDRAVVTPNSTKTNINGQYGQLDDFMEGIGNAGNPLDSVHISGNGGYDPTRSVFHMVMVSPDGDMSMDVNKPFLDKKPIISQTIQDGGMTSTFVADMSKLSYAQMNSPIKIINTTTFDDPTIPGNGAANFDMLNAQQSDVTAGRFTFTKPSNYGWNHPTQGWDYPQSYFTLGIYSYYGGNGFDVYNADWASFFDYAQNAIACNRGGGLHVRIDEGKASYKGDNAVSPGTAGGPTGIGSCPGH
jgi:hypothetical protein